MRHLLIILIIASFVSCNENENVIISDLPPLVRTASFQISGESDEQTLSFNSTENLIFCQLFQNNEMWIRLARDQDATGENGPHIDIDLCDYSGSGTYSPINPQSRPCTKSGWDIWWHNEGEIYFNQADSNPCNLVLTQSGDTLRGVFNCDDVILKGGESLINIRNGKFETLIIRK